MFITLEGPDGSGKTTQIEPLVGFLRDAGFEVISTREPGGTAIGDQVRKVLFDLKNQQMHPRTEILLFQASRAQHVEQVIRPSLAAGKLVICDRYIDSTIAYQGYGHQMDLDELETIVTYATGGLKPDLTLLFDVDVETGLKRRDMGGDWNRLDAYELGFHRRVRKGYIEMVRKEPHRWRTIDASQPPETVQQELRRILVEHLQINAG